MPENQESEPSPTAQYEQGHPSRSGSLFGLGYGCSGYPPKKRRSPWFYVAAIGGSILAVILIPFVILVMLFGGFRIAYPYETSARNSLRVIHMAQLMYSEKYPLNGYSCSLSALGGDPKTGQPTPQSAQIIFQQLASGRKDGYTFAIRNCTKVAINGQDRVTGYEVTAVPDIVGKTGDHGFCIDQDGVLTTDPTGGSNCTQPVQ